MASRVLIVEDDHEVRALERTLVESDPNLVVEEASTIREALDLIQRNPPDLVILDLLLPDGEGTVVLAALRADRRLESVPVLVVTAMYGPTHRDQVKAAGAADIMYKPFDARAFVRHVASLVARSSGPGRVAPAPG